jgi:hypothetical protein
MPTPQGNDIEEICEGPEVNSAAPDRTTNMNAAAGLGRAKDAHLFTALPFRRLGWPTMRLDLSLK